MSPSCVTRVTTGVGVKKCSEGGRREWAERKVECERAEMKNEREKDSKGVIGSQRASSNRG